MNSPPYCIWTAPMHLTHGDCPLHVNSPAYMDRNPCTQHMETVHCMWTVQHIWTATNALNTCMGTTHRNPDDITELQEDKRVELANKWRRRRPGISYVRPLCHQGPGRCATCQDVVAPTTGEAVVLSNARPLCHPWRARCATIGQAVVPSKARPCATQGQAVVSDTYYWGCYYFFLCEITNFIYYYLYSVGQK